MTNNNIDMNIQITNYDDVIRELSKVLDFLPEDLAVRKAYLGNVIFKLVSL